MVPGGRWLQRIDCPEGCGYQAKRSNMASHLMGGKHGWEKDRTWATIKDLPAVAGSVAVRKRQASGLSPLSYESRVAELVDCPQGCGAVTRRKRVHQHLENVHKIEHRAALRLGREAPVSESTVTRLGEGKHGRPPARNKPTGMKVLAPRQGTQGVDFTMVDPAEIAIAVVQSQVNGLIQTSLLPDVVMYVDHTRELIGKLRSV